MPTFVSPRISRFTVTLSAVALLLCHGAFGSLHELPSFALPDHPAAESHQGEPAKHPKAGTHDYAAALFALLLGTLYWFLRLATRSRNAPPPLRNTWLPPTARIIHLPYANGPPLLQVFRL